ncbi:major facilitator superfamily domain-containing protein [Talaromyces proteolyticus]|uniref:Major facilitator superfamily domain-containing protein n=1 Tax=Talaromyces proteolyticus TaxID=1131652 RepID=A0AAD4KGV5_9EURO|nr:major facilitator superfamily domain-containing protein [Talaromyces proteolyticus]KAH8690798.1 major facilitator superfamily domain-containing protein [Talaromyces proteolyticus]
MQRNLIPRPTNDPKDPLTWSTWRKHLAFTSIAFFVFLSNYITAAIGPALVSIIKEFNISQTQAGYLITLNILSLGVGNLFWIPFAVKFGKRPIIILSSAIFFGSSIWSALAKSYGSLLGARIIQGFGASSSEALGPAVVADLYFLHERGTKIGFYTFMIGGGSSIGGVFSGLVMKSSNNWRWVQWMCTILTGICFALTVLFQPETNFKRSAESELGEGPEVLPHEQGQYSWIQSLELFGGYNREGSLRAFLQRPIELILYPGIFWAAITYGVTLGWVVLQQTVNSVYFPEQYGFNALAVGDISAATIIGALAGCFFGGPVSDWISAAIAKRKKGLFTPEMRLWTLVPAFILGPVGLMLWGVGLGKNLHWSVPIAGTAITYGILCLVPAVGMSYVVDSYKPLAGEAITSLTAFKNTFAFGISFAVFPWLERDGFIKMSGYMTLIEGLTFLTTVPLFLYGKQLRKFTSRYHV